MWFKGIFVVLPIAFGLMAPTTGWSTDMPVDRRATPNPATPPVAEIGKLDGDNSLSYFLTPFKLASQPNLKQSIFGFAGRTDSGNLGSTFVPVSVHPSEFFTTTTS